MIVEVKDLQKGDVVMFPSGSNLRVVTLLKDPELGKPNWRGLPRYKSIRCLANIEVKINTTNSYGRSSWKEWQPTLDNHNTRVSIDFNYKNIWLIKRDGEYVNGRI